MSLEPAPEDWSRALAVVAHPDVLDHLADGTVGKDPDPFLRGMAAAAGAETGVPYAVTFELIPL